MVASLKRERELCKMQVRRLMRLLTEYKRKTPPNGVPPSLLAELPEVAAMDSVQSQQNACSSTNYNRSAAGDDSGIASGGEGYVMNGAYRTGLHSRKASTVSTFLSSSTETTSGANSSICNAKEALQMDATFPPGSNCIHLSMWNELMPVCQSPDSPLQNGTGPPICESTKHQKVQETKIITTEITEDFPRLIHSHHSNCDNDNEIVNNNKMAENPVSPFAVCSAVLPSACSDTHELKDITASKMPASHAGKSQKLTKNAESTNFVMYI